MKIRTLFGALLFVGLVGPLGLSPSFASCAGDLARLAARPASARPLTIAARVPDIVGQITRINRSVNRYHELFDRHPDLTAREALESVFRMRATEAQRIWALARKVDRRSDEKLLADLLKRLARRLTPTEKEREGVIQRLKSPADADEMRTVGQIRLSEHDPRVEEELSNLKSGVSGNTGELIAALLLPNTVTVGLHVKDIPDYETTLDSADLRAAVEDLPDAERILPEGRNPREAEALEKRLRQKLFNKEIDVVFRGGAAWAEVKNFPFLTLEKLTSHEVGNGHHKKKSIYDQALENVLLARLFHKEMHMVLIHGISPEASRKLEDLGIQVHGIFGAPADLDPSKF